VENGSQKRPTHFVGEGGEKLWCERRKRELYLVERKRRDASRENLRASLPEKKEKNFAASAI